MHTVDRLLTQFTPEHYNLTLDLTKRKERLFFGRVEITGGIPKASGTVRLHAKDLRIQNVSVNEQAVTWKLKPQNDELALHFQEPLKGTARIAIEFEGTITDPMHGLYPSHFTHNGKDKEWLATQLESHYAREVFPCIDEPAAKATFDVTLHSEPGITVLGNTPIKHARTKDSVLTTQFETTPKMSSYLLAFAVGEMKYTEVTNKNGVLIRAYSTPGKEHQTKFALDYAAKTLEFFDDFFGLPYPLPKLDLLALPDFSAGAMENWGLITFREAYMLVDEANTPADMKETIASVVAHELAHQWFGNLVTMEWWDDLWLNESFAKWMESYTLDHLNPEWRVWEQFGASELLYALNRDGLANVQAVREPVRHPDELHSLFDPAIVYAKGACLIRMLQNYIGEEAFKNGLRLYMERHRYGNTAANDLWAALEETSGKNIREFMHQWLTQPGHPVVTANLDNTTLALTQRRFFANPNQAVENTTLWPLPLLSDEVETDLLNSAAATYTVRNKPVLLNKNHTGFYHTQYDSSMLGAIAGLISETNGLPTVDRQGLLVDGLALSRAGLLPTADLLTLLAHYKNESAYPVWQAMGAVIGAIRTLINDDPAIKPYMQRYAANLARAQFERLGWNRINHESYFDELLRPTAISLLAYADTPDVIKYSLEIFASAQKPEDITMPELRGIIYSVAVREKGEPAFNTLLEWYKTTQSADERATLAAGISALRKPALAQNALKLFTTKTIKPQDVALWFAYFMRSRHARPATWRWMQDNWGWITAQFKNSHDYADFPKYAASAMSTCGELEDYKKFFEPKLDEPDVAMVIRQGIEEIEVRALWRERDLAAITKVLKAT